jgi:protease-4
MRSVACGAALVLVSGLLLAAEARAEKKLLRLRLNGPVLEAPSDNAALMALFQKEQAATLRDWVHMIRKAAAERDINGLVLIIEQPEVGLAQVEELTQALKAFAAKGKPVYCYVDEADNRSYALAVAATHITIAENSTLDIVGLHGQAMFFKGLLDKLGIEADMMHCGAYKSALEPFTRTEPSPEAAANINWLLDGLYDRWIQLIAEGRKLPADEVKKLVDQAPLSAQQALEHKLVDDVSSFAAFKQRLHKEFGKDVSVVKKIEETSGPELDTSNPFALIPQIIQLFEQAAEPKEEPTVGLIYIDGGIVVGKSDDSPFGGTIAGSTTVRAALEDARKDDNVKAVVVRVDSPGGSALASDIIWEAATRCAGEKPLVVSMGGVAGSGGYYVSLPGDTIFAEATTITGSIGVVGGKLVLSGLMQDKLGITTTEFSRGRHAGLMSMNRKWNDGERAWMTEYMNSVYEQFKGRVTKSRGERIKKDLEEIAGGRVYTGAQALELGLVDKLGGLTDALDLAATKAGLGRDYEVQILPKPSGFEAFLKLLQKLTGQDEKDEFEVAAGSRLRADPLCRAVLPLLSELTPTQWREFARGLRNLLILQQEKVGCFMPLVPQIR